MAGSFHSVFQAIGTIDNNGIVTAADLSVTQTSTVMRGGMMENLSAQFGVVTGTPSGTFTVQASNDPRAGNQGFSTSAIWTDVYTVTFTTGAVSGSASTMVVVQNGAEFYRVKWVNTASTGTGVALLTGVSS